LAAWITLGAIIAVIIIYFVAIWTLRTYRKQIAAGREELIGKTAVVKTALEPRGLVLVEGERWTAIIDKGRAEPEEEVTITRVDGLKLMVTKK
jgi:membrane protein implicated in regulation of membrane protease activity